MDTEIFVGQEVLVKLTVDRITETAAGIEYVLKHGDDISRIYVPSKDIKEVCDG